MTNQTRVKVGRILKTFGRDGQLRCQIHDDFMQILRKGKFIWIEIDGLEVPLEIVSLSRQHKPLIRFRGVDTEYQANLLSGNWVYIRKEDYGKEEWPVVETEETIYDFLKNFQVNFANHNLKGVIANIQQYPGQIMAFIKIDEKELLVPLVEEFIVDIDENEKTINLTLPEGMLDL